MKKVDHFVSGLRNQSNMNTLSKKRKKKLKSELTYKYTEKYLKFENLIAHRLKPDNMVSSSQHLLLKPNLHFVAQPCHSTKTDMQQKWLFF